MRKETKIINQQFVVYMFKCDQCDAGYVGYTKGHLISRVEGHRQKNSSVARYFLNEHRSVPKDLLGCLVKKCNIKFDCLVYEMLFIKDLKPLLSIQSDSIRAKVFF